MSSDAEVDQALVRRIARVSSLRSESCSACIASGSAGWYSYGSTGACTGASTLRT